MVALCGFGFGAGLGTARRDVESLMDSIEDMELLRILSKEDKLTIQIAFLKIRLQRV